MSTYAMMKPHLFITILCFMISSANGGSLYLNKIDEYAGVDKSVLILKHHDIDESNDGELKLFSGICNSNHTKETEIGDCRQMEVVVNIVNWSSKSDVTFQYGHSRLADYYKSLLRGVQLTVVNENTLKITLYKSQSLNRHFFLEYSYEGKIIMSNIVPIQETSMLPREVSQYQRLKFGTRQNYAKRKRETIDQQVVLAMVVKKASVVVKPTKKGTCNVYLFPKSTQVTITCAAIGRPSPVISLHVGTITFKSKDLKNRVNEYGNGSIKMSSTLDYKVAPNTFKCMYKYDKENYDPSKNGKDTCIEIKTVAASGTSLTIFVLVALLGTGGIFVIYLVTKHKKKKKKGDPKDKKKADEKKKKKDKKGNKKKGGKKKDDKKNDNKKKDDKKKDGKNTGEGKKGGKKNDDDEMDEKKKADKKGKSDKKKDKSDSDEAVTKKKKLKKKDSASDGSIEKKKKKKKNSSESSDESKMSTKKSKKKKAKKKKEEKAREQRKKNRETKKRLKAEKKILKKKKKEMQRKLKKIEKKKDKVNDSTDTLDVSSD